MKINWFMGFFFLSSVITNAQFEISSSFNGTHTGRNISLYLAKNLNANNQVGIGIRYNIAKIAHNDDQMYAFWKRVYPSTDFQHYGIEGYYQKTIFRNLGCVKPFISYDMQVSYSTTRNRRFLPVQIYDTEGNELFKRYYDSYGPYTFIEQYIGIGYRVHLFGRFDFFQKIGGGIMFVMGEDEKRPSFNKFEWEFAEIISTGLIYCFKPGNQK